MPGPFTHATNKSVQVQVVHSWATLHFRQRATTLLTMPWSLSDDSDNEILPICPRSDAPTMRQHAESRSRSPIRKGSNLCTASTTHSPKESSFKTESATQRFSADVPEIASIAYWQKPLMQATHAHRTHIASRGLSRTMVLESLCTGVGSALSAAEAWLPLALHGSWTQLF